MRGTGATGTDRTAIEAYLRGLDRALTGPARTRADLLTEARHSLLDAAAGYRAEGLDPAAAQRRAVREFGPVGEVAAGYQAELAAGAARSLSVRVVVAWLLLMLGADWVWRGAPWTGPRPPAGYLLLGDSLDWLWLGCGPLALASLGWWVWSARHGRPGSVRLARVIGVVLTGAVALGCLGGIGLYAWSVDLWAGALRWPPMLVGLPLLCLLHAWLGHGAVRCLTAAR
ncbi:permease prefix domain 1-containing protein [Plantactinospora sp. CA-290183]|uniref:permease prefix domain 1-containing protein n=1 Tax=Plantactinospora sp. CA-290183 TaxID=3240006 RepID=UPI003D90248D